MTLLCAAACLALACSSEESLTGESQPREEWFEELAELEAQLVARVERRAAARVEAPRVSLPDEDDRHRMRWGAIDHPLILERLYMARDHAPVWVKEDDGGFALSDAGRRLYDVLAHTPGEHGLEESFELPDRSLLRAPSSLEAVTLTPVERDQLEAHMRAHDDDNLIAVLLRPDGPAPRVERVIERRAAQLRVLRDDAVLFDVMLSDALVHYARAMHAHRRVEGEESGSLAALLPVLTPFFEAPETVERLEEALEPPYPQYRRLLEAHARYLTVVETGGWDRLPETMIGLEDENFVLEVAQLVHRLRREGYWVGEEEDVGRSLRRSLAVYQQAHGLAASGRLDEETLEQLNVPAEHRLAQVRLALSAWRESRIGADSYYVHVNIPDFHVELWRDGVRRWRSKVIVGAGRSYYDWKVDRRIELGETPRMSDAIETLEFNPYWWIPKSIWKNEYAPRQEEDPSFYRRRGFEIASTKSGYTTLRQRPGPGNALGQVKFLFPNDDAIYLHDTNQPELFDEAQRNLSHGCVRVHNPLELARHLLVEDGQGSPEQIEARIDEWLKRRTPVPVELDTPVPIHIEYINVRVDSRGIVHFLSDPYGLEKRALEARG